MMMQRANSICNTVFSKTTRFLGKQQRQRQQLQQQQRGYAITSQQLRLSSWYKHNTELCPSVGGTTTIRTMIRSLIGGGTSRNTSNMSNGSSSSSLIVQQQQQQQQQVVINKRYYGSKRSKRGLYDGKDIRSGNSLSFSMKSNKRKFKPNVFKKRVYSEILDEMLRFHLTTSALRTIDKMGGLDNYLLYSKNIPNEGQGHKAKQRIIKKLKQQEKQKQKQMQQLK